jgi:hypothetical protein
MFINRLSPPAGEEAAAASARTDPARGTAATADTPAVSIIRRLNPLAEFLSIRPRFDEESETGFGMADYLTRMGFKGAGFLRTPEKANGFNQRSMRRFPNNAVTLCRRFGGLPEGFVTRLNQFPYALRLESFGKRATTSEAAS